MNFYEEIIDNIKGKMVINNKSVNDPLAYIQAIHDKPSTNPKGKVFYQNLLLVINRLKSREQIRIIKQCEKFCRQKVEEFGDGIIAISKINGFCPPPEIGAITSVSVSAQEVEIGNMVYSMLFNYGISHTTKFFQYIETEDAKTTINSRIDGYRMKYDPQIERALDKLLCITNIRQELQPFDGELAQYSYELYKMGKNEPIYRKLEDRIKLRVTKRGIDNTESEVKHALSTLLNGVALAIYMDELGKALNNIFLPNQVKTKKEQKTQRIPAKFYALYHWMRIEMGTEGIFSKNDNGKYIKSEIEEYATVKYPDCSPQGFYRSFKDLDIKNRNAIANSFGKGYKEILISISNNDSKLITYLKNYPN